MFGFIKSKKVFLAILRIKNAAERKAIGYEIFGRKFNDMLESHHDVDGGTDEPRIRNLF
jgi:hypothetical protein